MILEKKQRGASGIATMYLIVTIVLLATVLFKVGPAYMDNYSYNSLFSRMLADENFKTASRNEIEITLNKRLRVNGYYNFSKDYWTLVKNKEGNSILVEYEQRIPLFYNLSVVTAFSQTHKM